MTSSGFPKSSGDPSPHCLHPCWEGGEEGVSGRIEGLRGFREDAVAGAERRQVEVACPSHPEKHPFASEHCPSPRRRQAGGCGQRCP